MAAAAVGYPSVFKAIQKRIIDDALSLDYDPSVKVKD